MRARLLAKVPAMFRSYVQIGRRDMSGCGADEISVIEESEYEKTCKQLRVTTADAGEVHLVVCAKIKCAVEVSVAAMASLISPQHSESRFSVELLLEASATRSEVIAAFRRATRGRISMRAVACEWKIVDAAESAEGVQALPANASIALMGLLDAKSALLHCTLTPGKAVGNVISLAIKVRCRTLSTSHLRNPMHVIIITCMANITRTCHSACADVLSLCFPLSFFIAIRCDSDADREDNRPRGE